MRNLLQPRGKFVSRTLGLHKGEISTQSSEAINMKIIRFFAIPLLSFSFIASPALADDFTIDHRGAHAFVQFKASHLGYSYVIGRFNDFSGTFSYDPDNPATARTSVTIDASSVDSNHAERDKHLRSADFFAVSTYPEITFISSAFEQASDGSVRITGDLTLRGVTKIITIDGRHVGHGDDPWGGYRRGLEGNVILNAADFGFPNWVGEVEIYLVVEGIRK